jgi:hypothetical protein
MVVAEAKLADERYLTVAPALEAIGRQHLGCSCKTVPEYQLIASRSKSTADQGLSLQENATPRSSPRWSPNLTGCAVQF